MKKIYMKPSMFAITLQHQTYLAVSQVDGGDTGIGGGGDGSGMNAEVKGASIGNGKSVWDEEW